MSMIKEEKQELLVISHTEKKKKHKKLVLSELLFRRPQQLYPLKKPKASTANAVNSQMTSLPVSSPTLD